MTIALFYSEKAKGQKNLIWSASYCFLMGFSLVLREKKKS